MDPQLTDAVVALLKALTTTTEKAGSALDSLKGLIDKAADSIPKAGKGK